MDTKQTLNKFHKKTTNELKPIKLVLFTALTLTLYHYSLNTLTMLEFLIYQKYDIKAKLTLKSKI